MKNLLRIVSLLLMAGALLAPAAGALAQESEPQVVVLTFDGPVTPIMIEYLDRGIQRAEAENAEALIFQLDTPGGSIDLTQTVVEAMLASPVPIVVYVAPRGALAGSAGTVITMAGHLAAMAPETAIGAALPPGWLPRWRFQEPWRTDDRPR